jgi:proteasome lid subunit RPN8/RPN11
VEKLDLKIDPTALEEMKKDAKSAFPEECCGFFFGQNEEIRHVEIASPVHNAKEGDKKRRFAISPLEYAKAEAYAIEKNLKLLGVYHSHPLHPAIPSEHDRKVALPWFSYIILSINKEEVVDVQSYQLNAERQFETEIII